MEVGGGALGIELPCLGPLVGQRPVEMALKPQDAPQGIFEHAVAKIFIDHPAQRDLAGEQRGRQMIDPADAARISFSPGERVNSCGSGNQQLAYWASRAAR